MITSIRFSNFVDKIKQPAPIGSTAGYGTVKVVNPVPVYIKKVNPNG